MTKNEKDAGFTVQGEPQDPDHNLPRIDFSTFVLSLATSALVDLGIAEDPSGGEKAEPNLVLARQTIDTIEMLEEKTRGNLSEEEAKLVQSVLYELRMGYVKAQS